MRWDHGIELILGVEPSSCKIYPLSPNEQEELDCFLEEHLAQDEFALQNLPWLLPSSSSKRRMGSYAQSRT